MTSVILTPQELAASIAREFEEMTAKALAIGAVPLDPPLSQVAQYAYVRPAHLRTWVGE